MIKFAPKSRRYGEAFETATNDAYLAQEEHCPDAAAFAIQVEQLGIQLQAIFPVVDVK
jgi:hypothetical protein